MDVRIVPSMIFVWKKVCEVKDRMRVVFLLEKRNEVKYGRIEGLVNDNERQFSEHVWVAFDWINGPMREGDVVEVGPMEFKLAPLRLLWKGEVLPKKFAIRHWIYLSRSLRPYVYSNWVFVVKTYDSPSWLAIIHHAAGFDTDWDHPSVEIWKRRLGSMLWEVNE